MEDCPTICGAALLAGIREGQIPEVCLLEFTRALKCMILHISMRCNDTLRDLEINNNFLCGTHKDLVDRSGHAKPYEYTWGWTERCRNGPLVKNLRTAGHTGSSNLVWGRGARELSNG